MIRLTVFAFLLFSSVLNFTQAGERYTHGKVVQGPYKTTVVDGGGELSFLAVDDLRYPISLVLDVMEGGGVKARTLVDKYEGIVDTPKFAPKIESLFFYPVHGKKNVLVLVSWVDVRQGSAHGTFYQVYAYEKNIAN